MRTGRRSTRRSDRPTPATGTARGATSSRSVNPIFRAGSLGTLPSFHVVRLLTAIVGVVGVIEVPVGTLPVGRVRIRPPPADVFDVPGKAGGPPVAGDRLRP